jgi:transcriptional regulator NrdR family protein
MNREVVPSLVLAAFTLDIEVVEKLNSEPNKSGLINSLLYNYFKEKEVISKDQIDKKIVEIKDRFTEEVESEIPSSPKKRRGKH